MGHLQKLFRVVLIMLLGCLFVWFAMLFGPLKFTLPRGQDIVPKYDAFTGKLFDNLNPKTIELNGLKMSYVVSLTESSISELFDSLETESVSRKDSTLIKDLNNLSRILQETALEEDSTDSLGGFFLELSNLVRNGVVRHENEDWGILGLMSLKGYYNEVSPPNMSPQKENIKQLQKFILAFRSPDKNVTTYYTYWQQE